MHLLPVLSLVSFQQGRKNVGREYYQSFIMHGWDETSTILQVDTAPFEQERLSLL